jgi:hypothetical protein
VSFHAKILKICCHRLRKKTRLTKRAPDNSERDKWPSDFSVASQQSYFQTVLNDQMHQLLHFASLLIALMNPSKTPAGILRLPAALIIHGKAAGSCEADSCGCLESGKS